MESSSAWNPARIYLDAVSGRRRGPAGAALRGLLALGVPVYALVSGCRNRLFETGCKRVHHVGAAVVSVGNLTVGGTGKTPTVAWVADQLAGLGRRPALVSRGYRALSRGENDEKRLLDQLCPGVPHEQDRDRVAAAKRVIQASGCDAIVLDDGFQHRRLHRDVDLVLIDALNPWGYGRLLPRGLLREGIRNLARADAVLITRSDLVPEEGLEAIRRRVAAHSDAAVLATAFAATRLVDSQGGAVPLGETAGKRPCAFCGIGNPEGFRRTLTGIGAPVSEDRFRAFPDHHHYSEQDLAQLEGWAGGHQAEILLTTRKDLVKIGRRHLGGIPLWGIDIALTFRDPPQPLVDLLAERLGNGTRRGT